MLASSVELLSPICHHSSQWHGNFAEMPDDTCLCCQKQYSHK